MENSSKVDKRSQIVARIENTDCEKEYIKKKTISDSVTKKITGFIKTKETESVMNPETDDKRENEKCNTPTATGTKQNTAPIEGYISGIANDKMKLKQAAMDLSDKHFVHKEEKRKLADLHLKKMPYITYGKNKNRLVAWTDVKEILFPSCSHPKCDIVVNALKLKLRYPWSEDAMHACTPKEQVAFVRKYRIVPSGVLLVDIDCLKPQLEELWEMVRIKHQHSDSEYSRKCHYAEAQVSTVSHKTVTDHGSTSEKSITSLSENELKLFRSAELHPGESDLKTPELDIFYVLYAKAGNRAKQETDKNQDVSIVQLNKIKIPSLKLKDNVHHADCLYVPAYLIELCFPSSVKFLIQACRDHLVGSTRNKGTHCCSVSEGRAFTRWMCKSYGWSQNWRHITSRDILVRKTDLDYHLSPQNPTEITLAEGGITKNVFDINDLSSVPKFSEKNRKDEMHTLDTCKIQQKAIEDIRRDVFGKIDPSLVSKSVPGLNGQGCNYILDDCKTPQNNVRQPKKRQRIKSPNDSTTNDLNLDVCESETVKPSAKMNLSKETGIVALQNVNNSALTSEMKSLDRKTMKSFSANSEKKKTDSRLTQLEVRAFGKPSRHDMATPRTDVKSKMIHLEDKLKAQWDLNRSKMKLLEERILKKLEGSRVSREGPVISDPFTFKRVYGATENVGDSRNKADTAVDKINDNKSQHPIETLFDSERIGKNPSSTPEYLSQSNANQSSIMDRSTPTQNKPISVINKQLHRQPMRIDSVSCQKQSLSASSLNNIEQRPMFIPQFYPYRMSMHINPGHTMYGQYNQQSHIPIQGRRTAPQNNVVLSYPIPYQSQSSCSTTNKNRLQNFYLRNNRHVTFQPVGNWPRQPSNSKTNYHKPIKHPEDKDYHKPIKRPEDKDWNHKKEETVLHTEGENIFLPNRSNTEAIRLDKDKPANNNQHTIQTIPVAKNSQINQFNSEKRSKKCQNRMNFQPKLPNDLVGSIVEESMKSFAKISCMASNDSSSKSESLRSNKVKASFGNNGMPTITLLKNGAEMEITELTKMQGVESENNLLALVSANPFTQSLESLKAMKDIMNKQVEKNKPPCAGIQVQSNPFKQNCAPIQRSYGCLGASATINTDGCQNSQAVDGLIPSNINNENVMNYMSKINFNCKGQTVIDHDQSEGSKTSSEIIDQSQLEDTIHNCMLKMEKTELESSDTKGKSICLYKGIKHPFISKSHGCISSELLEDEKKLIKPARQSMSVPSLSGKKSLFRQLHKNFGSYESVQGEDLKMTFYKIKDPKICKDACDKASGKMEKDLLLSTTGECEKLRKKEKHNNAHRKALLKNHIDDEHIELDDTKSILAVMQRSYKKHENIKFCQATFNSSDSYKSAEKLYKANQSNVKSKTGKGNKFNTQSSDGKTKSIGSKQGNVPKYSPRKGYVHSNTQYEKDMDNKYCSTFPKRIDSGSVKCTPKEYDQCKVVLENLKTLTCEESDCRSGIKENTYGEPTEELNFHKSSIINMNSEIAHPKKRWMKEFMVCCPQKIEKKASMDLLALEENTKADEWSKDLSNFAQYDTTLNSKTCTSDVDIGNQMIPPVLKVSNLPKCDEEINVKSPPMPQLEMIRDNDFTVDHEEEVGIGSESNNISTASFSSSKSETLLTDDTSSSIRSCGSPLHQAQNHTSSSIPSCGSPLHQAQNHTLDELENRLEDTTVHYVNEECGRQYEDNTESDLAGSLYVVDDVKNLGEYKVYRRSARQSLSPKKPIKTFGKSNLDRIYGSKINLRKPSPNGKRKKSAKTKNRKTPEKKQDFVKRNKNLTKDHIKDNNEILDDKRQAANAWQNVVKEQKIMMEIIKRTTPKKEATIASAKSDKSEESVDRAMNVPPCNTPCSMSDEHVLHKEHMISVLNKGYGDGFVDITESVGRDREDFAEFCINIKLEPAQNDTYFKEKLSSLKLQDYKASGDVDKLCDSLNVKNEGFMKPDAHGFLYEPIKSDYGLSKGGLIYHDKCVMPYVMINGYKYVAVLDLIQLFTECVAKCVIPRTILHKHKGLFKSYCNWEQVYVLDLLYMKRGRSLKTGDMLLRFDTFLKNLIELKAAIKEKHRSTTYKRSQSCSYTFD